MGKTRSQEVHLSRLPTISMLIIASAMVIFIGLLSFQSTESRRTADNELSISRRIHDATDYLVSLLTDAETGQRGYLLTGKDIYLNPYNRAVAEIPGVLAKLRSASPERTAQAERISELEPVVAAKLQHMAMTVDVRRSQGLEAAVREIDSGRGKALMDDIRSRCAVIRDISERRTEQFASLAERSSRRLSYVSILGSAILLGLIGLSGVTILSGLSLRERLFRQAADSAEFLAVTLNSIGDGVIATDAAGAITLINPVAQKLTGWSETEARGIPIERVFRIVNETDRKAVENPAEQAILTGSVTALANHTILISKNGDDIPIDDSGAPIRTPDGQIQGGVLVFRDISARRDAERQLKESNEQLKDFVSAAAHDLRSPLNSVSTMAQLLALRFQSELDNEGSELLHYIIQGTQRMLHLLEDLLTYAQASHFEVHQVANRASMERAFRTALENLRAEIQSSHAAITADPLPDVAVHEAHLLQLLQNLIGNALKYRSEAAPRIHVACSRSNRGWQIQVSDNGIGIDARYQQQIFKPFKRLHGDDRPGTGIGLATCQKIVTGYGGKIWVTSEPGKGSTFCFTLPEATAVIPAQTAKHA